MSKKQILKSIEKSMRNGLPIMIDYLPLVDTEKYFSKEEINKRRMRRLDKKIADKCSVEDS